MKALKIALPVLLILLIGTAAYLYFFSGMNFSSEYYLAAGDKAYAAARYDKAADYYAKALDQTPEDVDLILKLADAYSEAGNYSKAEFTLVGGINRLPDNIALYTALSKAYVAQDKLLDAARLIEGATSDYAKTQLSDKRPSPPVISPDTGEYDEFVTVSVSYPAGTVAYVSTNGDFPSTKNPAAATQITTSYGTTKVCAVSVSEAGLVSEPAYAEYTVANVIEDVAFTDPQIEKEVRAVLEVDDSVRLTTEDLWQISSLFVPSGVMSLEDLRWFGKLPAIVFESVAGLDLSQLSMCTALKELTAANCGLSAEQLKQIGQLTNLTYLNISGNGIVDLSPLAGLTELNTLLASDNSIFDLGPLAGLSKMQVLDLSANAVEDISSLWAMTAMTDLKLTGNPLAAIDKLSGMSALMNLDISGCNISDAAALAGKSKLVNLNCSDNKIPSLDMLTSATALETLNADYNSLTSIAFVTYLKSLKNLSAANNAITTVPDLSDLKVLNIINLSNNQISDISGIHDMALLNFLYLDYNNVSDLSSLLTCNLLVEVDVFNNPVTDIKALKDMGVIVNKGVVEGEAPPDGGEAPPEAA